VLGLHKLIFQDPSWSYVPLVSSPSSLKSSNSTRAVAMLSRRRRCRSLTSTWTRVERTTRNGWCYGQSFPRTVTRKTQRSNSLDRDDSAHHVHEDAEGMAGGTEMQPIGLGREYQARRCCQARLAGCSVSTLAIRHTGPSLPAGEPYIPALRGPALNIMVRSASCTCCSDALGCIDHPSTKAIL